MIITIDGPAGAGKSTVARRLADELGFAFLDTGAMYRAMTYAAMSAGIELDNPDKLLSFCRNASLEWSLDRIRLDGTDISSELRTPEVSRNIRFVADHPVIRGLLVDKQRELAADQDIVCEGRDQGTVAFPNAQLKIFLSASAEERAKRRVKDLQQQGISADFESILFDQERRDKQDRERPVGRLKMATDAIEFSTDGLEIEEVVQKLKQLVTDSHENLPSDQSSNSIHPQP